VLAFDGPGHVNRRGQSAAAVILRPGGVPWLTSHSARPAHLDRAGPSVGPLVVDGSCALLLNLHVGDGCSRIAGMINSRTCAGRGPLSAVLELATTFVQALARRGPKVDPDRQGPTASSSPFRSSTYIFGSHETPESGCRPLPYREGLVKASVRLLQETITAIDPSARRVFTNRCGQARGRRAGRRALGAELRLAPTPPAEVAR